MTDLKKAADLIKAAHNDKVPGDTVLVGLNKAEFAKVQQLLGKGRVNSKTGLHQFGYGAANDGGRNEGAGGKPDKDKSDGGGNGNGGNAGDKGGGGGNTGGRPGGVGTPGVGGGFDGTGKKPGGNTPAGSGDAKTAQMNSLENNIQESSKKAKPTPTDTASQVDAVNQGAVGYKDTQVDKARRQSQADAADEGDTWFERNIVKPGLSAIGLGESPLSAEEAKQRVDQAVKSGAPVDGRANWDLDPLALGATIGGLLGGPIGSAASLGYAGYRALGGPTPSVDLGPDVFGGSGLSGGGNTNTPDDKAGGGGEKPLIGGTPAPMSADVGTPSDIPASDDEEEKKPSGSFSATSKPLPFIKVPYML